MGRAGSYGLPVNLRIAMPAQSQVGLCAVSGNFCPRDRDEKMNLSLISGLPVRGKRRLYKDGTSFHALVALLFS
jgi:hypothetical protein